MVVLKKHYDRIIGLDVGNGLVNIRTILKDGKPYLKTLPAIYALKEKVGKHSLEEKQKELDVFKIDGHELVWGRDVISIQEPVLCNSYNNRYKTFSFRNLVKMALAKVYKDIGVRNNESVLIITGVPSDETKTKYEQQMRDAFTNDNSVHDVKINDEQVLIKLEDEDIIIMSQPVATVIGRYLDFNGDVQDSKYEDIKVAVIDVGGGTTDFDTIDSLDRLDYKSINKGFISVYDDIRADIKKVYPDATPTDFQLLSIILDNNTKGVFTYQPNIRVEPFDFTESLERAVEKLSALIQTNALNIWKNQSDIDEVLLVGGSAPYFEDDISKVMDGVEVPKNNSESNVDGYYKYGVFLNKQMKESVV